MSRSSKPKVKVNIVSMGSLMYRMDTGRIQIQVLTSLPFVFISFWLPKTKVSKSEILQHLNQDEDAHNNPEESSDIMTM